MRLTFGQVDGHLLLSLGGRTALLDTGAPVSFGRVPRVELPWAAGGAQLAPADPAGREVGEVSRAMRELGGAAAAGVELDLLLGCDLLAGLRLTVDWAARRLTVEPLPPGGEVRHRAGLPTREVGIAGRRTEAVLDTGARLSYVRRTLAAGARPQGSARDFNFLSGRREDCEVPLVLCAVELDGASLPEARLGLAVGFVEKALRALDLGAIVGTDLMARTRQTVIDLPRREGR